MALSKVAPYTSIHVTRVTEVAPIPSSTEHHRDKDYFINFLRITDIIFSPVQKL